MVQFASTSSYHAQGTNRPDQPLSSPNQEAAVVADPQMRRNALTASDIIHSDATVNRVWGRINTLLGGDDSSGSQVHALRRMLMNLTGEVQIQHALNHDNTQNAQWMLALTASYLDIGALNTLRANYRTPRQDTLPELDGSSQHLAGGRGTMIPLTPAGIDQHATLSSAELTDRLLALMETVEVWILRERNLSESQIYRTTILQNMHLETSSEQKNKIAAAYETIKAFSTANPPPDGPSLDLNFANLDEPQNIERLYQLINYLEKSYHTSRIFDYSDEATGVKDGIAAIAQFKELRNTLFASLNTIDEATLKIAKAQEIMNKVVMKYAPSVHNNAVDARVEGSQVEAVAHHDHEHHMLHVLEACGEKDHNAWIQKCETFEELLQFGNSIMRKAEYRAAADHGGFYNEDQFLKVFLTYAAREKLFQARDGRKAAERKATGTRYFEFQKNLNGFHDNIRRRILSLVPPAFDNHGHIVQENDGRQLVELYRACPNLFYASQGSQTNDGEYAQMLCILTNITLYENPQLAGHSSHNSPLSLAQVIAQDRIRHANAAYQLYYSEMTSADVREQHGWRDNLAERVTRATHNTGMIARFLGKPTKIFGKTFETLTKGVLATADWAISKTVSTIGTIADTVEKIGNGESVSFGHGHEAEGGADHGHGHGDKKEQGIFTRVLLGIPCSILSAPLSVVNMASSAVGAAHHGIKHGVEHGYHHAIHALSHSDDCKSISDALCIACEHLGHSTGGVMSRFTRWLYDHGTHHQKQAFIENFYRRLTPEQVANLRLGYEYTQMASGIYSAPTILTNTDRVMSDNWARAKKPLAKIENNSAKKMIEGIGGSFERRYKNMREKTDARANALGTEESKDLASRTGIVCDLMIEFSQAFQKLKSETPGSPEAKLLCGELSKTWGNGKKAAKGYEKRFEDMETSSNTTIGDITTEIGRLQGEIATAQGTLAGATGNGLSGTQNRIAGLEKQLSEQQILLQKETKLRDSYTASKKEFKKLKQEINEINQPHTITAPPAAGTNPGRLENLLNHMRGSGVTAGTLDVALEEFLK